MTATPEATTALTPADHHEHTERHNLIHHLQVSALYHQRRARFFDFWDKWASAIAVLGSTTAIVKGLGPDDSTQQIAASIVVAVVSTLALVFGFSGRARLHSELARDFSRLLSSLYAAGDWPGMEKISAWKAQCYDLQSQEPAPLTTVLIECENQLHITASGKPKHKQSWVKRFLGQFIDFPAPPEGAKP